MLNIVRRAAVAAAVTMALIAPIVPAHTAQAAPAPAAADKLGCMDEPVQMKPYAGKPFKYGKRTIHFGIAEWHFPPSCEDQMRRPYVKIYKVKKGKDPKVYSTTSQTKGSKKMKKGTYRVKVKYAYRYYLGDGEYGSWHSMYRSKTIKLK